MSHLCWGAQVPFLDVQDQRKLLVQACFIGKLVPNELRQVPISRLQIRYKFIRQLLQSI